MQGLIAPQRLLALTCSVVLSLLALAAAAAEPAHEQRGHGQAVRGPWDTASLMRPTLRQSCLGGHSRAVSVVGVPSGALVRLAPVLSVCDSIRERPHRVSFQ